MYSLNHGMYFTASAVALPFDIETQVPHIANKSGTSIVVFFLRGDDMSGCVVRKP